MLVVWCNCVRKIILIWLVSFPLHAVRSVIAKILKRRPLPAYTLETGTISIRTVVELYVLFVPNGMTAKVQINLASTKTVHTNYCL